MTKILKLHILLFIVMGIVLPAHAQESQVLSVTPPLFQLAVSPGDIWQSNVKVVNGNSYPLTVFTEVVNFEPTGEVGQGKFVPILAKNDEKRENATLAEWIEIVDGPHTIPAESTKDISFFVDIPEDASPGGHYAAILISTEPPEVTDTLAVKTTQTVTSLFFVRIEGDIVEQGSIREFRVTERLQSTTEAEFLLRFENKGNVHLLPRGEIKIFNMWGTERGVIPINQQTQFGNVLPNSIREYKFKWQSDFSVTDIGRYKAELTLAYGDEGIKNVQSDTYFYVLPIKGTAITLAIVITFILLVVWMVKAYIRRMLSLAGVDVDLGTIKHDDTDKRVTKQKAKKYKSVSAPIKDGVLDLRNQLSSIDETVDVIKTVFSFIGAYKMFFISVALLVVMFVAGVAYISLATEEHKRYQVIIDQNGEEQTLTGEEIEVVKP